jgi:3-hydroxymyristoyl/3-hydroxydecanoyl-(acyl carrier protein) dehydratase
MMYSLPADYQESQFLSIDWGAWSDVGMASKGNMPHLMSLAGIEMISPDQAAPLVRMELEAGTTGEVMLSGSLGQMESSLENKPGVDIEKSDKALREGNPIHSMLSHLKGYGSDGVIRLEADLDPREQPFLKDHALNGVPVLPGVMGIEGFAVAAKHIASVLALSKGKFEVVTMEDIHFHAPFKFYRNQPRHITWKAYCSREAEGLVVYVNLESELEFKVRKPEKVLHFSGKVRITEEKVATSQSVTPPAWLKKKSLCSDDIYKLYFHGPSFQVLDCAQKSGDVVLGKLRANLLPITTGKQQTISTPLLVELCFQTAGLWEAGSTGVMALPHSIESLTLFRAEGQTGDIYAEVRPNQDGDELSFDARVVDSEGNVYLELKNYRTAALPYAAEKQLVEPLQVLLN